MTGGRITLLFDRFSELISAAEPGLRCTALETLLARGKAFNPGSSSADELRCALFGLECVKPPPVAAATRLADGMGSPEEGGYWLRLDPVSLWPDMARVIMTGSGFTDYDEQERKEIENTVRTVLRREGIELHADQPERWTIALDRPLPFQFTPLEDALGMDMAAVMPDHPDARYWRRMLNEIQMALHACPVNTHRRQQGRIQINSVWFWGGGSMPQRPARPAFQTVYSSHPVSRGLAVLHGSVLYDLPVGEMADLVQDTGNVLLDWSRPVNAAVAELGCLDEISARLLRRVKQQAATVCLYTTGRGWVFDRRCMRRWWHRRVPLARYTRESGA